MNNTCINLSVKTNKHEEMDIYGKVNNLTIVFADWHPNPSYRIFKTGSLLSKNEQFPSGLVIINEKGNPMVWKV